MADTTDKAEKKPEAPPSVDQAAAAIEKLAGGDQPAAAEGDAKAALRKHKPRGIRAVPVGVAHVKASFNNTVVAITDLKGNVIAWSSSGRAGFKGSRKSTAFAATVVAQDAAKQAVAKGMSEVEVQVQGAGAGRESAIRAIQSSGIMVSMIKDITPMAHNGCRPRKRRRV